MQDTKKVAGELLVELEKKGVTFETVDGKLKYKDSKGNFTENSKEKVKKYKEEIIEILKKKQTIDEFITDNDYETNVYPLTDVQAAYLVGKTEAVKWGGIGCKGYIEVDFGSYSAEELSRAWKVLVNRHEMLRAKVTEVGFEILERDEIDYEIKIVNLQKMAEREKVDTLSKIREDFSEYVFHTEEPPLFKVLITKRIEGNFFHLLVDLIVSDFASVQLLISEMGELLKGASLEKIRYKFSDYAMFNQQRKGSLKWHQDRMYWLERLKKLPEAPILPQDGRAADKCENTYEFYRFQKHINQSDWKRIKEIAGEYGVTVSSVLIGIYAEVISRWSSNKHFTLNLPIQNRPTIGNNTNSIVGDFTAVNLLEVNVTQNMSFIERVKEITKRLMEDLEHNSFSGVEVLRELSKVSEEKELLMPIVFTGVLKTDGTVGTIEYGFSHTPQVWIDCQIVDEIDSEDQEKGLMISWDTRKGAIKESIVTEMFESFTETIRILGIKHSEEWKNPLEIIVPSASKKKVICERNKGITNQSRIQQRFVKYAKKNSNKTAVIDAVETVTYGELLERAEYIAGYLRKEFVENRTGLVAIRMKKSVNQIAAVMGVLIAGFSYLPIDIKQPLARQEKILSKANVIVELDEKKVNMILQNLEYRLEKHPEFQNPIAYVIFTSGSTGEPKGVVMSHTAAQNTLISIENIDRKGLAESIQKNIKVKHNAKATLISQKKEYVELAKSIKKIVCSISGNDYIDYEDNLLENGLDSLLLSQISGRIVSDIQEAQGMRFDEILRASLTMPTIMGIAQYISDCKNPSKNQMHSNAGNQTRNSYTVVYIFGDNENEIRDVLIEKLSASNISCKRVGGQEIIERCHEDISVKKKYIIAFSEMASLCITKASELLGENIIINRIFLINPSKAKESDLYLGDISIIDGNSVAIKSWEKAVLGNVREFESNSNDIFDIIMRELENDK